jgi:hypothetical protein
MLAADDRVVLLRASVPRLSDRSCAHVRAALSDELADELAEPVAVRVPTHEDEVVWLASSAKGEAQFTSPEGRVLDRDAFVRHLSRTKVVYDRLPVVVLDAHDDGVTWDVRPTEEGFASTLGLTLRADEEGVAWTRPEPVRFDPKSLVRPPSLHRVRARAHRLADPRTSPLGSL